MNQNIQEAQKTIRKRGRPKKIRTPEELAKIEEQKRNKKTLKEKQAIKLKAQREKEAAKGSSEPMNKDRFYCKNAELNEELLKWRDSNAEEENRRIDAGLPIIYEDRILSEKLGEMLMTIGKKLLNHSNFRNYSPELKEDMLMFGIQKIIKGLKNYNFEFNNPFAWFSMAFWNGYLTIIYKHYKQINIKKDLMKKLSIELQTYAGIDPRSSLNQAIKTYIGDDIGFTD